MALSVCYGDSLQLLNWLCSIYIIIRPQVAHYSHHTEGKCIPDVAMHNICGIASTAKRHSSTIVRCFK